MSTLLEYFNKRAQMIDKGELGAESPSTPEATHRAAVLAAKRDRSDPFVYGRVVNLIQARIYRADDFNAAISV